MAEMRLPARSSILLAGLLLLALPALAAAEPKPIAKPSNIAPIQPTKSHVQPSSPPAAPPATPSTPPASTTPSSGTTGQTSSSGTGSTGTTTPASGTNPPAKETVVVVTAQGGRDQSGIAVPAPPPPEPTPLGLVAAGDRATSPSTSTPAWKIALLALLAAAEAFLVVRLVRNRPGDLSPAS
jgi:cobalamin biosynthesis Mg chelatase CobN